MDVSPTVLKIGGSLLSPSPAKLFDFGFAYRLKRIINEFVNSGDKFVISVGGGRLARQYQELLRKHGEEDTQDIHRVGVAATNLNAQILQGLFDQLAAPDVLRYSDFDEFLTGAHTQADFDGGSVLIASGSRPGQSNDWNALQMAIALKQARVVSMKNVDGVYSSDPNRDPLARRIPNLTWTEYLEIIGNPQEHLPGASYPVDPLTARLADERGVDFAIIGPDLDNLRSLLRGDSYVGTLIRSERWERGVVE